MGQLVARLDTKRSQSYDEAPRHWETETPGTEWCPCARLAPTGGSALVRSALPSGVCTAMGDEGRCHARGSASCLKTA